MTIRIGVTGVQTCDDPAPGLAIARCLDEAGYEVVALAETELASGLYWPQVKEAYVLPPWNEGAAFVDDLAGLARRARLDVVVPTIDIQVGLLAAHPGRLAAAGVRVLLPSEADFARREKSALPQLAEEAGIRHPRTVVCADLAALMAACRDLGYPCLVKGRIADAHLVQTQAQARAAYQKLMQAGGSPVIAQERIVGDEIGVAVVGDGCGNAVRQVQMKKVGLTASGTTWAGATFKDPALWNVTVRFLQVTRWRGPAELEFLRTAEGEYYLFEVNPRFPSWIYLSAIAGCNLPDHAMRVLLHGATDCEPFAYEAGKLFIRIATEVELPLTKLMTLASQKEWKAHV